MTCNKIPVGNKEMNLQVVLICNKRKGHKGSCEMTYHINWTGQLEEKVKP